MTAGVSDTAVMLGLTFGILWVGFIILIVVTIQGHGEGD